MENMNKKTAVWYDPKLGEAASIHIIEDHTVPHWVRWIDPEVGVTSFACSACGVVLLGRAAPLEECPGCGCWMTRESERFGFITRPGAHADERPKPDPTATVCAERARNERPEANAAERAHWIRAGSSEEDTRHFRCSACGRIVYHAGGKCPGCWQEMSETVVDEEEVEG